MIFVDRFLEGRLKKCSEVVARLKSKVRVLQALTEAGFQYQPSALPLVHFFSCIFFTELHAHRHTLFYYIIFEGIVGNQLI